jgi:RNA ligase
LIFDLDGNIVARGFRKFWNYFDLRHPETLPENFPVEPPTITRKMDGSLGVLYLFDSKWYVSTRGSFMSEQAVWASKWLAKNCLNAWPTGYTPLTEIVYPENQIVVKYDFSGLVLLALVNIETGEEMDYSGLCTCGLINGIHVVESFDKPLSVCVAEDDPNEEGYVAAWPRPGTTPLRVKIKYATYVTLHRLLTQTNAVTVWEMLRDGLDLTTLTQDVPTEFKGWIAGLEARFVGEFHSIETEAWKIYNAYAGEKDAADPAKKKAFALYATAQKPSVTPILFAMLCGKQYAPIIWKQIRPRGDERPFKADIDG